MFPYHQWTSMNQQRSRQRLLVWADFGVRMLSSGALMALFGPGLDTQEEQPRIPPITTWQTIPKRSRLTITLLRSHMGNFWIFSGRATSRAEVLGRTNTKQRSFTTMKNRKDWLWQAGSRLQLLQRVKFTLRSFLLLPFTWQRIIIRSIDCSSSATFCESSKPCIRTWKIW